MFFINNIKILNIIFNNNLNNKLIFKNKFNNYFY